MVWGMNSVSLHIADNLSFLENLLMCLLQAWVMGNQTEVLSLIDRPGVEGYITYGGSVVGNETHPPEVVQYYDLDDWEDGILDNEGKQN